MRLNDTSNTIETNSRYYKFIFYYKLKRIIYSKQTRFVANYASILSYYNVWNSNINSTVLCGICIIMFKLGIVYNKVDRIQYLCYIVVKCFVEFLSMLHCLWNKQTLFFVNMLSNQKQSIISSYVLIISDSKINTLDQHYKTFSIV